MRKFIFILIIFSIFASGCRKRRSEIPMPVTPETAVMTEPEKENIYLAGIRNFEERNYRKARQCFYSIWQSDRSFKNTEDYYFRSTMQLAGSLKDKRTRESIEYFREAYSLNADNREAKQGLAEVLILQAERERSDVRKLELLDEAYRVDPRTDTIRELFDLYKASGKLADGLNLLEEHFKQNGADKDLVVIAVENLLEVDVLRAYAIFQANRSVFPENDAQMIRLDGEIQKQVKNNYQGLALVEKNKKNWDGVVYYLEKAREMGQENAKLLTELGEAQLALNQKDKAFDALSGALQYDPQNIDVLRLLRRLYQERKEYEKLIMVQKKIVELLPYDNEEKFLLVEMLARREQFDEAMTLVDDVLQKNPEHAPALEKKAFLLFQKGRLPEAKKIWTDLYKLDQSSPELNFYLGIASYKERDLTKAAEYLQRSIQRDPLESKYYYYYLLVLKDKGDYGEMEMVKEQLNDKDLKGDFVVYLQKMFGLYRPVEPKELSFNESENYYSLGLSMAKKGDYDKALDHFRKALAESPDNIDIMINIGNIHFVKEDFLNAAVQYFRARRKAQDNFYVNLFLSRTMLRLGLSEEAGKYLKYAEDADKDNNELIELSSEIGRSQVKRDSATVEKLARHLLNNQLLPESRKFLEEVLQTSGNKDNVYYNLGNLALMEGKEKDAVTYLEKAIQANPDYLDAYLSLGKLHSARNPAKAVEMYLKAMELDGSNLEVMENLAGLYLKSKQYANARKYYQLLRDQSASTFKQEQIDNILKTIP
ncbi:MAG: tetratricopeptide repeat protein [Candidatus Wallbacteria bacterium]|nr:tetratricopeptide repeat protein [Candidatus Wallbacteria bacterium]